jgi:eukaryotic-like serine/threonine-protein kinase
MTLAPGTQLGPYEITAPLGAGGMGEVYRARDTRLERTVAIKILPGQLSADPARKQRFEREAKAISTLNHPNICVLYDVGNQDGIEYLVMECIEGETLAKRLERGALPTEQVLKIGTEIADALDKAHRSGVVHRDLKPGNIMLSKAGAKLLDFGLAKPAVSPASAMTITGTAGSAPVTEQGMIVGTFQYMSPEQVEGKELDGRSDIFSLGAMLYEMLTGRRAFEGKSQLSVASAILEKEPASISIAKPLTPRTLDHVIRRCLAKDPDERWQTSRDLALELKSISQTDLATESAAPVSSSRQRNFRELLAWGLVGLLALTAVGLLVRLRAGTDYQDESTQSSILPPEKTNFRGSTDQGLEAISPDGRYLVFSARSSDDKTQLWLRSLDSLSAKPLVGTDGASNPFWSSDSKWIAFFSQGRLRKVFAQGGSPQELCEVVGGRGGSWNKEGTILFVPGVGSPVYSVPENGGTPTQVTQLDPAKQETTHRWPQFLPDGRHFLFFAWGPDSATYVSSLGSTERKLILKNESNAVYVAPGYLLYAKAHALIAQPFDLDRLELSGNQVSITDNLPVDKTTQHAMFSASQTGTLSIHTAPGRFLQPTWVDRSGTVVDMAGESAILGSFQIAPDGQKVAFALTDPQEGSQNIWIYDLVRNLRTRLTFEPASAQGPVWSPDGKQIVFTSNRTGALHLYAISVTGVGQPELFMPSDQFDYATSWSLDGRYIAVNRIPVGKGNPTIWILPTFGDKKPYRLLNSQFNEFDPAFSPDGRWLAFRSTETGRGEVYIVPFPTPSAKWQVSTGGGSSPRWSPDGKDLYYIAPDGTVISASLHWDKDGIQVMSTHPLFKTNPRTFDISPDGKRFLIYKDAENQQVAAITLITNWPAALKK